MSFLLQKGTENSSNYENPSNAVQMQGKQLQERVYGECMNAKDAIEIVVKDAVELQSTKPLEPDELSDEMKFRIYNLIVNEIGKHFYNCEMRMSYKDFILVEDCIRKVLQGEQDEHKTD